MSPVFYPRTPFLGAFNAGVRQYLFAARSLSAFAGIIDFA